VSYYVRFYADRPVALKALGTAIKSVAADYKIDGGDLMRGADVLAEIGIDSVGTDMFVEELSSRIGMINQVPGDAAQWVANRIRGTQSIVSVRIDPQISWDLLAPLWSSLSGMSTGLTQVDGQGFYDGPNFIFAMA